MSGLYKIGKPAPSIEGMAVVKGTFKKFSLEDFRDRYVLLLFYPLDFTFVCPTEVVAFSDRCNEFRSINCEIVAISTDSQYTHLAWINTPRKNGGVGDVDIPLLSDKTMKISRDYKVLDEDTGICYRAIFILDRNHHLRQVIINDYNVGRSVDEILRLVQAYQFADDNGEVCPVNWKSGQKTIIPDVHKANEYFLTTQIDK